jgi:hypothetical protein
MKYEDFANRFLEKGRELYEAGDKSEIMYCLSFCIRNCIPIPEWLRQAFNGAYHAALMHKVASWDDVFGKPLAKGKWLATAKRNLQLGSKIAHLIQKRRRAGKTADFNAVGMDVGVGSTVAKDAYYNFEREGEAHGDEEAIINRTANFGMFRKLK